MDSPGRTEPEVLRRELLGEGRWLRLEEVWYRDAGGAVRRWECSRRVGGCRAVCMIARLVPSNRLILVRQFRPPAEGMVLEFPAGLVDDGEDAAAAAKRELREECGYSGRVVSVSPPGYSSAGLTDEAVYLARLEVDETLEVNRNPAPAPDPGEYITVLAVPAAELMGYVMRQADAGIRLDAKLLAFAMAGGWA